MITPSVAAPAFALVRAPVAPMHAEPRVASPQVSQTLFGHAINVTEPHGDWHRVRTLDGYEGWVHAGYLAMVDGPPPAALDPAALRSLGPGDVPASSHNGSSSNGASPDGPSPDGMSHDGPAAVFEPDRLVSLLGGDDIPRVSLGCTVRAGGRRLRLPLGAWVHGPQVLLDGEVVRLDELPARFPRDADTIVRTASRWFEGASYQWGGVTPWGADCSGMVQTVLGLHGVAVPRDAWQQATTGTDAGADVDAVRPADLLFFSDRDDGRITHVGLSLGAARMAHLALGRGGWSVEALSDRDDPYVVRLRERFVGARRVI